MKIYIAGKITGDDGYRAKFQEAAKNLEALGHVALNTPILPVGLAEQDYMQITLAMLNAADMAGDTIERAWCKRTGKDCALYSDTKGGGIG